MQTQFSLLFGGIFSTLETLEGNAKSPYFSKTVSNLTRFLELGLYTEILQEDVVNWVNSEVLDDLVKDKNLVWKHFHISKWFLETFPHVYTANIIYSATYRGNLELVRWLVERYSLTDLRQVFVCACNTGHLEICKWMVKENKLRLDEKPTLYESCRFHSQFSKDPFELASKCCEKHVNIFEWAYQNNPSITFPWIRSLRRGYFDLVKYMAENQDIQLFDENILWLSVDLYRNASLEMLKWVFRKWPQILNVRMEEIFVGSLRDPEKVEWLMEMPHNRVLSSWCIYDLIRVNLKLAERILDKYPQNVHQVGEYVFRNLCWNGDVKEVEWFISKYPETNVYSGHNSGLKGAIDNKNLKVVTWFVKNHKKVYMKVLRRCCKKMLFKRLSTAVLRFPRFVLSYIR